MPRSRPKPDCLKPPNGEAASYMLYVLTHTVPALNRLRGAERLLDVPRPDAGGEAVDRCVRDVGRPLTPSLKRHHRQHRAEDLLARDRHLRGRRRSKTVGCDEVSLAVHRRALAAAEQLAPSFLPRSM